MPSRRKPRSLGDVVSFLGTALPGLEAAGRSDPQQQTYFRQLAKAPETLTKLDRRQEGLKRHLKETTKRVNGELQQVRVAIDKVMAYLEWKYGAKSDELKKYGVIPKHDAGRRKKSAGELPSRGAAAQ